VPEGNVHRIHGEDEPPAAAALYEQELLSLSGKGPLLFDLTILGMGADGHTASLFPGSAALAAAGRLVLPVAGEGAAHERITLTLTAINRCRTVLFLVAGAEKAGTVRAVIEGSNRGRYPAALVRPAGGRTLWFLDRDAGRLLRIAS
jgi:6-phosphogluconolactonase